MARAGRKDRGLLSKADASGRIVWYVRLYHDGRERRFGSFKTKTEARDFYEKAKQEQKQGRFFPERYQHGGYELLSETIDKYMISTTMKKALRHEKYFADWWKAHSGDRRLNAINPSLLEEARQGLLAKPLTPQRVNRYLAWLRHVLNIAVRDGKISSNPVCKLKMFKESAGKTRFLSIEEEKNLMAALGPTYAPWARLAILTGLRQKEQFSLRWKDIDLERGIIALPTTKAGCVQYVHMNEEAKQVLQSFTSWQNSVWVFPSENPATHIDPLNFYHRIWMTAVANSKIEWCTWHDLRHTFASRLAMNGAAEGTIAALLRHSTTALVRRYAHLSPSHLKDALESVASFGRSTKTYEKDSQASVSNPTVTETGIDGLCHQLEER